MPWNTSGTFAVRFSAAALTANREVLFPDASGVVVIGAAASGGASTITLHRQDILTEGGQLNFNRAAEDNLAWAIDVFGAGSTDTALRFIDAKLGSVPMYIAQSAQQVFINSLYVSGTAVVNGNLQVLGVATLSAIAVAGNVTVGGNITASSVVTGILNITGNLTVGGALVVSAGATVGGNLTVSGTLVTGALNLTGTLSVGGALAVSAGATIGGAVIINNSISATGSIRLDGGKSAGGILVGGDPLAARIELGQNATIDAPSYIDFHAVTGVGDFEFRILRAPGLSGTAEITQTGGGIIKFDASAVAFTGLISASGGANIGGGINITGGLNVGGAASFAGINCVGTISLDSNLVCHGAVSVSAGVTSTNTPRAWTRFNGFIGVSANSAYKISAITRIAIGTYSIDYAVVLASNNYFVSIISLTTNAAGTDVRISSNSTQSIKFRTFENNVTTDSANINFMILATS